MGFIFKIYIKQCLKIKCEFIFSINELFLSGKISNTIKKRGINSTVLPHYSDVLQNFMKHLPLDYT